MDACGGVIRVVGAVRPPWMAAVVGVAGAFTCLTGDPLAGKGAGGVTIDFLCGTREKIYCVTTGTKRHGAMKSLRYNAHLRKPGG